MSISKMSHFLRAKEKHSQEMSQTKPSPNSPQKLLEVKRKLLKTSFYSGEISIAFDKGSTMTAHLAARAATAVTRGITGIAATIVTTTTAHSKLLRRYIRHEALCIIE
jgi:hypothetical protein